MKINFQARGDMNGADGLKQHFAEINFFSRARNTGKMGEVVDKLKANLRQVSDDCHIHVQYV